jgi:hypothetical protein
MVNFGALGRCGRDSGYKSGARPLWVISGHLRRKKRCPLYPRKRTLWGRLPTFCLLTVGSRQGRRVAARPILHDYWSNEKSRPLGENPSYVEGAMEIVFWVIVAIVALVIAYICAVSVAKRRRYRSDRSAAAPDPKEHGVDLQARRKLHDDVT